MGQWRKLYLESLDRQLLHAYRPLGIHPGELRQLANCGDPSKFMTVLTRLVD